MDSELLTEGCGKNPDLTAETDKGGRLSRGPGAPFTAESGAGGPMLASTDGPERGDRDRRHAVLNEALASVVSSSREEADGNKANRSD